MRKVVVDANVLVSFFVERDEKQRSAAKELLLKAVNGELELIVPQFVVFEIMYVFQSAYRATGERLATMIRDVITLPGAPGDRRLSMEAGDGGVAESVPLDGRCRDRRRRRDEPIRRRCHVRPETRETTEGFQRRGVLVSGEGSAAT